MPTDDPGDRTDSNAGDETDVGRPVEQHGSYFGSDETEVGGWRDLAHDLTTAESVAGLTRTVKHYGWIPPFVGLASHGAVRGVFEHLADPIVISQGYFFQGWELALGINLFYGFFLVLFSWFFYFGLIGGFAGYLSDVKDMDTTVFMVGGYLSALYAPIFLVGTAVVLTIPASDVAIGGLDTLEIGDRVYGDIYATTQMRIVSGMRAIGWILVGFLMLPIVGELFDLDEKGSVLAVLPVTLAAVVSTQLV